MVVGVDQLPDGGVELGDLMLEGLDDLVDGLDGGGGAGHGAAVGLLRQRLLKLAATGHQGGELGLVLRAPFQQHRFGQLGVADQDAGVDRVGLGQDLQADRQVADVRGVDVRDRQVGLEQGLDQRPLVAAGRLDDDAGGLLLGVGDDE